MYEMPLTIRPPAVAGRFYKQNPSQCRAEATQMSRIDSSKSVALSGPVLGAVAPHAGWVCSGRIAGEALARMVAGSDATTVLLLGALHTMRVYSPAIDTAERYRLPMGDVAIDMKLRNALAALPDFELFHQPHAREHSLEVEVPFLQVLLGEKLKIVCCLIPPEPDAPKWGAAIGKVLKDWPEPVTVVASTDLTHYGPNYRFAPMGAGDAGYQWAHGENDQRMIDLIEKMDSGSVVREVRTRRNACGGGAIAATIEACKALGATKAVLVEHSDSVKELAAMGHTDNNNSVGYAGMLIG